MAVRLTNRQQDLLRDLGSYGILSGDQVAIVQGVGRQAARKRMSELIDLGLVEGRPHGFGRARGRPARIYSLNAEGVLYLKNLGFAVAEDRKPGTGKSIAPDHQLLLNWCLLHLQGLQSVLPQLTVRRADTSRLVETPERSRSSASTHAIPDAVFSISNDHGEKVLLFFLEVDMASETVASPTRKGSDFRSKIVRYHEYFRSGLYKRYEQEWDCQLRGFRLLVVTSMQQRLAVLCRLVREMPPSDFVWLADRASLFSAGMAAAIWVQGGNQDSPPRSILGSTLARPTPLLPVKP